MHPGTEKGYALDMVSVVRHVATVMEEKAPAFSSIEELAATYRHIITGDLSRVRRHHGFDSDGAAVRFLIECAVDELRAERTRPKQVVNDGNGGWRLTRPFDKLRYQGRPLRRDVDEQARLNDPFNPNSGEFAERFRSFAAKDLAELRESMAAFGWLPQYPALLDERGTVLDGHRRLTVAAELGIPPRTEQRAFGRGDSADAERIQVAIAGNIGGKPLGSGDRRRIAEYLYDNPEWSLEQVAEALRVAPSDEVRETTEPTATKGPKRKLTPEQRQVIRDLRRQGGLSWRAILGVVGEQFGVSQHVVQGEIRDMDVEDRERARIKTLLEEQGVPQYVLRSLDD